MSLNRSEMAQTALDLNRHLDAARLSIPELADWLGLRTQVVEDVLAMNGDATPATVWLVRDALDQAVSAAGGSADGWSVLTDQARTMAQRWFALSPVPPRVTAY